MLKYAILGMLKIKPMSGYDIDKLLNESIKNFWNIRQSQIYNEFKKLENLKLITYKEVKSKNKQTKKIYEITQEGEKEFLNLFNVDNNVTKYCDIKFLALTRMFYGFTTDDRKNVEFLKKIRDVCYKKLEDLKNKKVNVIDKVERISDDHEKRVWYWTSVVNCGEYIYQSIIDWANDSIKDIEKILKSKKWEKK